MTKKDLVREVAARLNGASQAEVKIILEATEQVVDEVIRNKDRVPLLSYLYVSGETKAPRVMRNPYTDGKVEVPKRIAPKALFTTSYKKTLRGLE